MSFRKPVSNHRDTGQPVVINDVGLDTTRSRGRTHSIIPTGQVSTAPMSSRDGGHGDAAPTMYKVESILETENNDNDDNNNTVSPDAPPAVPTPSNTQKPESKQYQSSFFKSTLGSPVNGGNVGDKANFSALPLTTSSQSLPPISSQSLPPTSSQPPPPRTQTTTSTPNTITASTPASSSHQAPLGSNSLIYSSSAGFRKPQNTTPNTPQNGQNGQNGPNSSQNGQNGSNSSQNGQNPTHPDAMRQSTPSTANDNMASIEGDDDCAPPPEPGSNLNQNQSNKTDFSQQNQQNQQNQPKSSFFKRAFSRFSVKSGPVTTPSTQSTGSNHPPSPKGGCGGLEICGEEGPEEDCLPQNINNFKRSTATPSSSISGSVNGQYHADTRSNKDSFDVAAAEPAFLGTKNKQLVHGNQSVITQNNQNNQNNNNNNNNQNSTSSNNLSPHSTNSNPFLSSRGNTMGGAGNRKSTDIVRIARVFIDPELLSQDQNISQNAQNDQNSTKTSSNKSQSDRSSFSGLGRRVSFTGNVQKLQPICLTCHFRPTGDSAQDRDQILHSTLIKLQLSTESTNTATLTTGNGKGINIHQASSNNDSNSVHSGVSVVGGEDLLSLLSTPGSSLFSDEIKSSNSSNNEENDSIVASFDEKSNNSTLKKSGFLSRQFSLAKFGSTTPSNSNNISNNPNNDVGQKDVGQKDSKGTNTPTHTQAQNGTNSSPDGSPSPQSVVLQPITRQAFDPSAFTLVPYNSSTGISDLSTLSPSQRNGIKGLGTQNHDSNDNDDGMGGMGNSSLRKMSISTGGFILEYSLISILTSELDYTVDTDLDLEHTYSNYNKYSKQRDLDGVIVEEEDEEGAPPAPSENDNEAHPSKGIKKHSSVTIPPPPPSGTDDNVSLGREGSKKMSVNTSIPPPPSERGSTTSLPPAENEGLDVPVLTTAASAIITPSLMSHKGGVDNNNDANNVNNSTNNVNNNNNTNNNTNQSNATTTQNNLDVSKLGEAVRSDTTLVLPQDAVKNPNSKENELFMKLTGGEGNDQNGQNGQNGQNNGQNGQNGQNNDKNDSPDSNSPPSLPKTQKTIITAGSALPDYVKDISYVVTDTPVLHLDLVKVNKIKRKLPRTLTFTPTQLITSVTHKHDCYHEMLHNQIRNDSHQQPRGSTGSFNEDMGVVFASAPTPQINNNNTPNVPQNAQNGQNVPFSPQNGQSGQKQAQHSRQQSETNATNGELFTYASLTKNNNNNFGNNNNNNFNNNHFTNTTSPDPSPALPIDSHSISVPQSDPNLASSPTGSLIIAATSPTRPLSPNLPPTDSLRTHSNSSSSTQSILAELPSTLSQPQHQVPVQGTVNNGIIPYLYRNETPDQCPRCGQTMELTFSCPLSEVLYASVVHIHSIRLCYLTRPSQLYLADNAPLVATFINMYLSMARQKNLTSSLSDLNKIVATHRILSTGAVRFIAVKMNALEQGSESVELYSAQKININGVSLSHSVFSQLGRKMVLTQFIPHVVNTQALSRAYPAIHQYVLSKGKNETQLVPPSDPNGGGSIPSPVATSLLTTQDLVTTSTATADAMFNMFITGGTSFASDPALSGFGPMNQNGHNYQNYGQNGQNGQNNGQNGQLSGNNSNLLSPRKNNGDSTFTPLSLSRDSHIPRDSTNTGGLHYGENSDDEDNVSQQGSSYNGHSLMFNSADLTNYLSASNSLQFSNSTLEFAVSAVNAQLASDTPGQVQYSCSSEGNLLVNTIREVNSQTIYSQGNDKLGLFSTNIRIDRSYVDQNNQITPEVLQYLAASASQEKEQREIREMQALGISVDLFKTSQNGPNCSSILQTPLSPTNNPSNGGPGPSVMSLNESTSNLGTSMSNITSTTLTNNSTNTTSTLSSTLTGSGGSANSALLLTANPLNTVSSPHPFSTISTLPFLYLDSEMYSQLLGITISPGIWRLIIKIMLVCSQPHIFKTVINTIPLIHNNHHQIMLTWIKTYELYKVAYDKYYTEAVAAKNAQQRIHTATIYQRNDAFANNKTIGDDDFTPTTGSSVSNTVQNALTVQEDIFDIQDPTHIFNTHYLSKGLKEQISKIDKEGSVLLYRTKQLTSALSQYVQQQHYDELCQFAVAPHTTIDAYAPSPDVYLNKVSIWQQLHEQMEKNEREGKSPGYRIEEPDYDTMATHATQYAIELVIAPPLTPLLDVYLSLKCHAKDHKLYQICLYHTTHRRKQSDYNIPIHLQSPDKWMTAISTIKQITTVYTAVERLQCLLTCCKYIYHTYKLLIHTRQTSYNIVKAQVNNGFYSQDLAGFSNVGDINLDDYINVTKIQSPNQDLIQKIIDYPRKEYLQFRKNKPIIEEDIEYGKYIITNRIPTVAEINGARHGILVKLVQETDELDQDGKKIEIIKNQFILHKDDIGPTSSLCADDFFPIFVYVIMHAKIAKLETIKQYIGSMAPRVSLTGEVGYYFTVFEAVIEYIDTLTVNGN